MSKGGVRFRILNAVNVEQGVVSARLTLLLLVLYGAQEWHLRVPTVMLAACSIVLPGLAAQPAYWLTITAVQGWGVFTQLYTIDNHKVLMVYWCFALGLSVRAPDVLRKNGRRLIGLCFMFATYWKLSPGFRDGSFLHFTLLTDSRFSFFAEIFCGVSDVAIAHNRSAVRDVVSGAVGQAMLWDTVLASRFAYLATWWTLLMESAIAALFLVGTTRGGKVSIAKNAFLLIFIVMTYPIATVIGFAWLLCIMAYAQCGPGENWMKLVWLSVFTLLQLYVVPWRTLVY